ncbi:hypothetical protein [Mucilaginibacter myungsuensis]|uniref:Uncharacterized protein n=1 Tax=Mucilaginibacter myungsuensis TaxID=649104 RepID=A0A929PWZ1_9SPHI|nr:hypothetical protein [Mucilaginibacter myungsuensis]MBE9661850.1 hypothetical protein [Mucilaginibacter myungsuensis]MDN3599716.1 hypothetical protein [Mucilaginibacter myungsuensis]
MTTSSLQAKKPSFIKLILIYLGILSAIFLFRSYAWADHGIRLQVEATSYELVKPNDQLLEDGNKFSSGTTGRLDWKPKG